ncbi:hypothetical protein A2Y85_08020 [candidate division WOR-3 bacterium RBG_13_43_14]|uniref:Sporulation stage II protein D amidase enhancer LytB N-terminal domain-containing protein n=1 Tax=candidate division WOR-3 bacterium RBG_13_43_14 TaxID=1802590 RepID=A0A1F4U1E2_UNCW3|nr:MAG: hypothetical protein A2Y85_08020 [candidate division WOR-3 bacterium RBG_13_43_14]
MKQISNGLDYDYNCYRKYLLTAIKYYIVGLSFFCMVNTLSCTQYLRTGTSRRTVRIALINGVQEVVVSGRIKNKYKKEYSITPTHKFPIQVSASKGIVSVNKKPYRGKLNIDLINSRIWVINIINIEDYLQGVVPCEIGKINYDLLEAAKAQAIAARTYAAAHIDQYAGLGFDLYATIRDQVYNGYNAETEITNQAVKETKGRIIVYNQRPIEAKYHSTCGGRTADFTDAWAGDGPTYLRSVACPYCRNSPHYLWKKTLSKKDFFRRLRAGMAKIGTLIPENELITNIRLTRNKISCRIRKMTIETNTREYALTNYQIRTVFGEPTDPGSLLKSNYIEITVHDDSIIIIGHGFGHGVGMCQFGAIEMATQGFDHRQILLHYYPGTRIVKY